MTKTGRPVSSLDCDGPALIHCGSSKRRSGTFLAIEFALSGRERNGHIDSKFRIVTMKVVTGLEAE